MDELRADIKKKLPKIKDEEFAALTKKLDDLGVRDLEDARENRLEVENFESCIPLFMARKLIGMWAAEGTNIEEQQVEAPIAAAAAATKSPSSTSGPYVMPDIDFKDFSPEIKILLNNKSITRQERLKVLNATAQIVLDRNSATRNFTMTSWTHVAEQLAAKNERFFDAQLNKSSEKTVYHTSVNLCNMASLKFNKRGNSDDSPGASGSKRTKISSVQRDEYGLNEVDFNVVEHTSDTILDIIIELQDEHQKARKDWDMSMVHKKMSELSLHMRYKFLIEKIDCEVAKASFPFLFEEALILDFFKNLTDIDADSALEKFVDSLLDHAYNHFTRFGSRRDRDDFFLIDKKLIASNKILKTKQPKLIATLMMAFFHLHDEDVSLDAFIGKREVINTK
jgi:hypothetical protein